MKPRRELGPIDYVFLVGMPLVFVLVAWFGITSFLPHPSPNPITRLKNGEVAVGMSVEDVRRTLGAPHHIETQTDGGQTFVYRRTVYEGDLAMDDAYVDFTPGGRVMAIRFERVGAPPFKPGPQ